jgi:hypothetical protein
MTTVGAIAYGNGVFVAVGTSASATAGKIATKAAVADAWTDRTSASGLTFAAGAAVVDVVFNGTVFVLIHHTSNAYAMATSPDGITWTARAFPIDQSTLYPLSAAASWPGHSSANMELTTDGAGTVVINYTGSTAATRSIFAISTDNGVTWACASPYLGKAVATSTTNVRTMSYANGRWIENHSGSYQSCVDVGPSLAAPDYIGQQFSLGAGQFVRIK